MRKFYQKYEFWAWVAVALGAVLILWFSISPAFATYFGNNDLSVNSQTNSYPNRFTLDQEGITGITGFSTSTPITLKIYASRNPLEGGWDDFVNIEWTGSGGFRNTEFYADSKSYDTITGIYTIVLGNTYFSTNPDFRPNEIIGIRLNLYSNGINNSKGSASNVVSGVANWRDNSGYNPTPDSNIADLYFEILQETAGISGTIEFSNPTNSTTTDNFFGGQVMGLWEVSLDLDAPQPDDRDFYLLNIQYHASSSDIYYFDNLEFSISSYPFQASMIVKKDTNLTKGYWKAKATLYHKTIPFEGNPLFFRFDTIGEDEITFYITTEREEFRVGTSTILFALEECPDSDKFFSSTTLAAWGCSVENGFKKIINAGASGIVASMDKAGNLALKIFPLNIYKHLNSSFNSVVATSAPAIVLSSSNPDVFGGHSFTILSDEQVNEAMENVGFNYKNVLDKFLYFFTGLIILYQSAIIIKHLRQENA